MAETIPFKNGDGPREDESPSSEAPSSSSLGYEFTSEEVSEIIRVALRKGGGREENTVNRAEMLAIAEDFGLTEKDLDRAVLDISESREEEDRSAQATAIFRLHMACFGVIITGLFLINLVADPSFWWFLYPLISWGMLVAIHGFAVKYAPEFSLIVARRTMDLSKEFMDSRRNPRAGTRRASFVLPNDRYGGMMEARGLVQIQGRYLMLEFQSKDKLFGLIRTGVRDVRIPIEEIESVRFERKFFSTKLVLQGRMMKTFNEIPGAIAGEVGLVFERGAREEAAMLAAELARKVAEG